MFNSECSIWCVQLLVNFANNASDIVYGSFEIPHTYKEGTDLEVHIHWSPSSTNTGLCTFYFKYSLASMGGIFGAETALTMSQTGSGVSNKHQYISGNNLITGSGIGIGTMVVFSLERPTGDAFTGDAFLHSVGVHYEIDTMGSRQRAIK